MANHRPLKSFSHSSMYGTFTDNSENLTGSVVAEMNEGESRGSRTCRFVNYDLIVCGMLVTNFLIGNGFLALPYALYHAGLLYGVITLIVVTFLSYVSSLWTLEVMSRAQALEYNQPATAQYHVDDVINSQSNASRKQSTVDHSRASPSYLKPVPTYEVVPTRKFEIAELCGLFLGRTGLVIYLFSLTCFLVFTCWAYSTVVGATLSSSIPWQPEEEWRLCTADDFRSVYIPQDVNCRGTYWFYVAVFSCVVLPLSCLDLSRQRYFQIFTTCVRVITVSLMAGECIYDIVNGRFEMVLPGFATNKTKTHNHSVSLVPSNYSHSNRTIGPSEINVDPLYFSFTGWLWCIPVFLQAQVVQQSIPTLVYKLKKPNKLGKVFMYTFLFSAMIDVIYGVSVAWRFGHDVAENSALNWVKQRNARSLSRAVIAYVISFLPSLDVLSLFPMVSVTLANNLFVVVVGKDTSLTNSDVQSPIFKKLLFRISVAVVSIVGSIIVSNLFYVSKYAGIVGAVIAILFPALLQYRSKEKCKRIFASFDFDSRTETATGADEFHWLPVSRSRLTLSSLLTSNPVSDSMYVRSRVNTPYSTIFSSNVCIILCSLFALGLIFCSFTLYVIFT